jgi:hypothetical protein
MFLCLVEFWKRDGGKTDLTDLLSWLDRGISKDGGSADPAQEDEVRPRATQRNDSRSVSVRFSRQSISLAGTGNPV